MVIFTQVIENECITDRHVRDIDPLRHSRRGSTAVRVWSPCRRLYIALVID